MINVYIFNKSNNVSRFDVFKKFFECVNSKISLTCCTKTDAVYQILTVRWSQSVDNVTPCWRVQRLSSMHDDDLATSATSAASSLTTAAAAAAEYSEHWNSDSTNNTVTCSLRRFHHADAILQGSAQTHLRRGGRIYLVSFCSLSLNVTVKE